MQTDPYKHIDELLERFFDGETSNAEEQQLYSFFARLDVPDRLKQYKPVFGYFETGLAREITGTTSSETSRKVSLSVKKGRWILGACAAVLLLLLLVNTLVNRHPDSFDPYEGSYIVRNGVRITDSETIKPALELSIRKMERKEKEMAQLTQCVDRKERKQYEQEQQLRSKYQSILENISNKQVRREARDVLGIESTNKYKSLNE